MKTTIPVLIILLFVFATCKNKQQSERKLVLHPDPGALLVPDSLRYLLPVLDSVWYRDQLYRHDLNNSIIENALLEKYQIVDLGLRKYVLLKKM